MESIRLEDIEVGNGFSYQDCKYIKLNKRGIWKEGDIWVLYLDCYDFRSKKQKLIKAEEMVMPITLFIVVGK